MVARKRHESNMLRLGELLAKAKQLKTFPLFKIITVEKQFVISDHERSIIAREFFYNCKRACIRSENF